MGIPIAKMATIGLLPSPLKVWFYRRRGARIGRNVTIAPLSVIDATSIEIGDDVHIGLLSFFKCDRLRMGNRVRVGTMVAVETGDVSIGHDSVLMEQTVIGGMLTPRSSIHIGSRVKVFPYCFLNPTEPIVIEDDVGVGGSNYVFTHGSWQSILDGFPVAFGPVTIRRGVWLPWRVFILPNVEIGEYATIGAGSVINKSVPAHALAAGVPAKVLSAEGAYRRPVDGDARRSIFGDIARESADNFRATRWRGVATESGDDLHVAVTNAEQVPLGTVVWRSGVAGDLPADSRIVVSLRAIGRDERAEWTRRGVGWFDLEQLEASSTEHVLFDETRNFLTRYGIRMPLVTDPPFEQR